MSGKNFTLGALLAIVAIPTLLCLAVAAYVFGWIGEGAAVLREEAGPRAALWKYEEFVEKAKYIDRAKANVELMESRLGKIDTQYNETYGEDKTAWNPSASALYMNEKQTARDDLVSAKLVFNGLAQEYNTMSAKFNWAPFQSEAGKPKEEFPEYMTN